MDAGSSTYLSSLTMSANHTVTAVYGVAPPPIRSLTITSVNPSSGITVSANPSDNSGKTSGSTPFTLNYTNNTFVQLTAPATSGGNAFQKWQEDGANLSVNLTASLIVDTNHTLTAVYASVTGTLSIAVMSPNGGGSVQAGTSLPISWTVAGNVASVSFFFVEYSLNAGVSWDYINNWYVTGSGRSTSWAIPAGTASSQVRIRVRAFDTTGTQIASDISDANFTIVSSGTRPVAVPDCNNNAPVSGAYVTFYGSASRPSSGSPAPTIVSYAWDFGDGYTSTGATVSHVFTAFGARTFSVTLTVTDSVGLSDTKTLCVTVTGQALGPNTPSSKSQDPVNLATGNFIYDHTDATIPGIGFPFEFQRFYNSKDTGNTAGPMGAFWSHSYNITTKTSNGVVMVAFGDGRSETYTNSAGTFISEAGIYNTLSTNAGGTYALTTKEQTRYNFDTLGRLASIVDKNSNTLSLTYDGADALANITNSSGRVITFINDASHRIAAIIDPLNRTNAFAYSDQGDLISATDPRGGVTRYGYDDDHQMTNAIDPNGNQFVRNVYSTNRVVEAQHDALGSTTTFSYDFVTRITTVSNALGFCAIHKHDD